MNYDRIYEYRFKDVDREKKLMTWKEIATFIYHKLGKPKRMLDPAAGDCEFINQIPSEERWAVDMSEITPKMAHQGIKVITGNNLEVNLPENYFDGVFISNFLEHLHSQEQVAFFLERMYKAIKPGGRIAIMGPNFKYTYKYYFDFADHTVLLSEGGVAEHLYGAGFNPIEVHPKFLPLSFKSKLPVNAFLVRTYLNMPIVWPFMGKQFLLIGEK
jgi:ubiquinone/menaquinone biosynthesis C-methylase UbiE